MKTGRVMVVAECGHSDGDCPFDVFTTCEECVKRVLRNQNYVTVETVKQLTKDEYIGIHSDVLGKSK